MANKNFELNTEQKKLVSEIQSLKKGGRLIVSGRAGSGKTSAIVRSVDGRKALFLAPTHPAKAILEKDLAGTGHRVMTLQSAIGWKKEYDKDTIETVNTYRSASKARQSSASCPFEDAEIVIVDESSMVGSFLFNAIEDYANEFGLPLVYSGDPFQLPPVNDEEVIHKQGYKTSVLTESIRFPKDSSIYTLGEELRNSIEHNPKSPIGCIVGSGDIEVISAADWKADIISAYENGQNILAVTSDNRRQQGLRALVRGGEGDQLRSGDMVISKQTDELFRNGQTFQILKAEPGQKVLSEVAKCLGITGELIVDGFVLTFKDCISPAFVFADDGARAKLERRVKNLYDKGKLNYNQATYVLEWVSQINNFELAAFATVHKCQGRSVDTIYIDTASVLARPAWLSLEHHKRLLYTSITRAKKRVVLYRMEDLCECSTEPPSALAA